jgi:hypothetical protein
MTIEMPGDEEGARGGSLGFPRDVLKSARSTTPTVER